MSKLTKRFPIYAKCLTLYPAAYRKTYSEQILQTTADMLDDTPSRLARLAIWIRIAVDLPINIGKQEVLYVGGLMTSNTPTYIRRNSLIAGILLLPFFAAVSANGVDKLVANHTLYGSWLWRSTAVRTWALWLPALAFVLTIATVLVYICSKSRLRESRKTPVAVIGRLLPIAAPFFVASLILGLVFFHDSAQCWMHSPVHVATHLGQTWQCTADNSSFTKHWL